VQRHYRSVVETLSWGFSCSGIMYVCASCPRILYRLQYAEGALKLTRGFGTGHVHLSMSMIMCLALAPSRYAHSSTLSATPVFPSLSPSLSFSLSLSLSLCVCVCVAVCLSLCVAPYQLACRPVSPTSSTCWAENVTPSQAMRHLMHPRVLGAQALVRAGVFSALVTLLQPAHSTAVAEWPDWAGGGQARARSVIVTAAALLEAPFQPPLAPETDLREAQQVGQPNHTFVFGSL
jgi:hypothetical protein